MSIIRPLWPRAVRDELARLVSLQISGLIPAGRYDAAMRLVLQGWSADSAARSMRRRRTDPPPRA